MALRLSATNLERLLLTRCLTTSSHWQRKVERERSFRPLFNTSSNIQRTSYYKNDYITKTRQPIAFMSSTDSKPKRKVKTVKVTFVDRDGDEVTIDAKIGDSLLEVAKEYDIDLEGACEGTLSCSTCHLIVDKEWFDKIPDFLTEEEQDMLDLAFGLTETSRLGCQIIVSNTIDGIRLKVPSETRDIRNV